MTPVEDAARSACRPGWRYGAVLDQLARSHAEGGAEYTDLITANGG